MKTIISEKENSKKALEFFRNFKKINEEFKEKVLKRTKDIREKIKNKLLENENVS